MAREAAFLGLSSPSFPFLSIDLVRQEYYYLWNKKACWGGQRKSCLYIALLLPFLSQCSYTDDGYLDSMFSLRRIKRNQLLLTCGNNICYMCTMDLKRKKVYNAPLPLQCFDVPVFLFLFVEFERADSGNDSCISSGNTHIDRFPLRRKSVGFILGVFSLCCLPLLVIR